MASWANSKALSSLRRDGQQKVKPDWSIVLSFEHKLRKEAMKLVTRDGHSLADSLGMAIRDAELKETYFTIPVALRAAMSSHSDGFQQSKFQRFNSKGSSKSAPSKGKGKSGKGKGKEIRKELLGLQLAWRTPDNRELQSDVGTFLKKMEADGKITLELHEFDMERSPSHDLRSKDLWEKICEKLEEGGWFLIVSPPCNTFSRARFQWRRHPGPRPLRSRTWPKGFPWLSKRNAEIVAEANEFVLQCVHACYVAVDNDGWFMFEHPEDLGVVDGKVPGSIWQWDELHNLLVWSDGCTFAIHQCQFGALTSKPTRLMCSCTIVDKRCHFGFPRFNKFFRYLGPLPQRCGHKHVYKLMGKAGNRWNTSPSASYPAGMCKFIADPIYSAFASGRGSRNVISRSSKLEQKGQPVKAPAELSCERSQFLESSSQNIQCVDSQISHVSSDVSANVANVSSHVLCVDVGRMGKQQKAVAGSCSFPCEVSNDANPDVQSRMDVECTAVQVDSSSDEGHGLTETRVDKPSESFDLHACMNGGHPIKVEWDGRTKDFTDGFGLCSPTRWCPAARGLRRSDQMKQLALKTYALLRDTVRSSIADVRTAAFKLVTGKFESSPFSTDELLRLRSQWAALLPYPADAVVVDEGQPFLLRGLAQWLRIFQDPDVGDFCVHFRQKVICE
eukprot:s171_g28.t1